MSAAPPTTSTLDPADIEKSVLSYLRKRGFKQAEAAFAQEAKISNLDDFASALAEENDSALNTLVHYHPIEVRPGRYDETYGNLRSWMDGSLDAYKPELLSILFPMFVHCYLDMIEKGFVDEAQNFLNRHRTRHETSYSEEIQKLAGVVTKQHVQENELASLYRKNKFNVKMSSFSYELLLSYLQDMKYMQLLRILNQYINAQVISGQPLKDIQDAQQGILAGTAVKQFAQEIRLGLPKTDRKEGDGTAAATKDKPSTSADGEKDDDEEQTKKRKKDAKKAAKKSSEEFVSAIPLPTISEEQELAEFEDIRHRVQLSARSLPSTCCFTFANTRQTLNCVDVSSDAAVVAGGFSNSSIRLFMVDSNRGFDEDLWVESMSGGGKSDLGLDGSAPSAKREKKQTLTLYGHGGPVYGVSLSPDHKFVMSCSEDATARLWSVATGTNLVAYKGHNSPIWDVKFSPLGYYFATASHDRTARVWSTDHIFPLRIMAGHLSDVDCVQFHPNCNYIATGSSDKTIRLWDVQNGQCVRLFTGHTSTVHSIAFSPDGKTLVSGGNDKTVRQWDLGTSKLITTFTGHTSTVWGVDVSADNNVIASGGADNTVRVWDANGAATAKSMMGLDENKDVASNLLVTLTTKSTPVYSVKFTRRNLLLASGPYSAVPTLGITL